MQIFRGEKPREIESDLVYISFSFFYLNKLVLFILYSPFIPKTFLTKTTHTQKKHTQYVTETEYQVKKHFILS